MANKTEKTTNSGNDGNMEVTTETQVGDVIVHHDWLRDLDETLQYLVDGGPLNDYLTQVPEETVQSLLRRRTISECPEEGHCHLHLVRQINGRPMCLLVDSLLRVWSITLEQLMETLAWEDTCDETGMMTCPHCATKSLMQERLVVCADTHEDFLFVCPACSGLMTVFGKPVQDEDGMAILARRLA